MPQSLSSPELHGRDRYVVMEQVLLICTAAIIAAYFAVPGRSRILVTMAVFVALLVEYANGFAGEVRYSSKFSVRLPAIETPVLAPALLACIQLLFAAEWQALATTIGNWPGRIALWIALTGVQAIVIEWFGIAAGVWTWQIAGGIPIAAIVLGAASLVACATVTLVLTACIHRTRTRRTT